MKKVINIFFRKLLHLPKYIKFYYYIYWNRLYFYLVGIKYGSNMRVYNSIYLSIHGTVSIGDDLVFTSGAGFNSISRNIKGMIKTYKDAYLTIGNNVGIGGANIFARKRINIGNNVKIGGDCIIIDSDSHSLDYVERRNEHLHLKAHDKNIGMAPVNICDDVWLGARCVVLKGVTIGARSIIAAGSMVTKDIPADVIAGGNPCKVIRKINDEK